MKTGGAVSCEEIVWRTAGKTHMCLNPATFVSTVTLDCGTFSRNLCTYHLHRLVGKVSLGTVTRLRKTGEVEA